ncbi:hypothetical protein [Streptomyces sp. NPDC056323]
MSVIVTFLPVTVMASWPMTTVPLRGAPQEDVESTVKGLLIA